MAKYLFLDIDGVLNSRQWFESHTARGRLCRDESLEEYGKHMLDPAAVEYLNRIVARTGCRIVISSSWRLCFELEKIVAMLGHAGFTDPARVVDKTVRRVPEPTPHPYERGYEIDLWLKENAGPSDTFAILDDGADMAHLRDKLVLTDCLFGLSASDAEKTIYLLNGEKR